MVIPGGVAGYWRSTLSDQLTLSAEARTAIGKGASRSLRREGRVPAVIYGNNEAKALMKALHTGHFMNSVVMVDVGGHSVRTLPKDVSFHPVSERPLHVDFLRISEHAKVTVDVPVHFINELASPGIKRGGVLNVVRHELEMVCDAAEIPDAIDVDLTGYEVGDSIHISNVTLPAGAVSAITDRDFTIATIVAPSALKSSDGDTEEAAAEPAA
jgi:large subunit ribosomal protein L25